MNRNNPSGEQAYHWKGGRVRMMQGYFRVYKPEHHFADSHGYVMEHRLVWEESHKAVLMPWIEVHHINGIKDDNRPENLNVFTKSYHTFKHLLERRARIIDKRSCGLCGEGTYQRVKNVGRYHYTSADWHKNPLNKSQLICRKCFRRIMNKEFHKRV